MVLTSYFPQKGDFDIAWPGRVARHDLVYHAPPSDPLQYGMPIGNGDIGALLWCEDRKIVIAVNKCDLWDDSPHEDIKGVEHTEERTSLRHACRIIIDFGVPIFDIFYLKDFNGRLRLQDGCIVLSLETPFGSLSAEFFVAYDRNLLCGRVHTDFPENDGLVITLERYGSRSYTYWCGEFRRNPAIGLFQTETACKDGDLLLTHQLTTGPFVCAMRPMGEGLQTSRRTRYMASAKAVECPKEFAFFATVTTPLDEQYDEAYARAQLDAATAEGFDALLAHNEACWKAFWEESFLETDDDYLDNLWHLALYYACCGQRGRYPGRFINSLWNWNRDVQPWNYYFHWNQQQAYWGLNAAGHHELCKSYLNYRWDCVPIARKNAQQWYGIEEGLFVSDIADRIGRNSCLDAFDASNHTPVVEIALDFWRQYRYTCDKEFLKERALPYMLGAARFAAGCFVLEADGKYHAKGGSPYEGADVLYDVITELSMARALFPAVLQALEEAGVEDPEAPKWQQILENLTQYTLLDVDPRMTQDNGDGTYTILRGVFQGGKVSLNRMMALGRLETGMLPHHLDCFVNGKSQIDYEAMKGKYVPHFVPATELKEGQQMDGLTLIRETLVKHHIPTEKPMDIVRVFRGHHQASISPVFPMGVVGLKDRGTELFEAAVTTAKTCRSNTEINCSWDPIPIVLARLGLSDELDVFLYEFPSLWQYYNNGFMHYGPSCVMLADAHMPFRRDQVSDADNPEDSFWTETFPFRHMGLEPLGVLCATMGERLLQSYDGVIRVSPAYGKRSARFKLHAVGGFEVMAQIKDGLPEFVAIHSKAGNCLRLENPWQAAFCGDVCYEEKEICLATEAGKTYLFTPEKDEAFAPEAQTPAANAAPKVRPDRHAMLGLERSY